MSTFIVFSILKITSYKKYNKNKDNYSVLECKTCGGPVTCHAKLDQVLEMYSDKEEQHMFWNETTIPGVFSFYKITTLITLAICIDFSRTNYL